MVKTFFFKFYPANILHTKRVLQCTAFSWAGFESVVSWLLISVQHHHHYLSFYRSIYLYYTYLNIYIKIIYIYIIYIYMHRPIYISIYVSIHVSANFVQLCKYIYFSYLIYLPPLEFISLI